MLQGFPQCATVTPTDDGHMCRFGVGEQGGMRDHFVINEVIGFRQHDEAINDHQLAEVFGFIYFDVLDSSPLIMQLVSDFDRKG